MTRDHSLTSKQRIYADEYLLHGNSSRAYRAAYPRAKETTSRVEGCRLLANPSVSAYIADRQSLLADRYEIDQQRIVEEYGRIAFFDPRCLFDQEGHLKPLDQLTEDQAAAISSIDVHMNADGTLTTRIRFADKRAALDSLARHLGMFEDRLTISPSESLKEIIEKAKTRAIKLRAAQTA